MNRLKLITLVGTRPELIKLSATIAEADRHFDQTLVHTGQNYDFELNEIFFRDLGVRKPDYFLNAAGGTPAQTISRVIEGFDIVLEKEAPDAMLLLGDTNSCLGAIAAKRRKIPIFHMEAGNRCFDDRVPEEINRRIVDHISDVNLTYSEHARRYLIAEGFPPDRIIKTGTPMAEVLALYAGDIQRSNVLNEHGLAKGKYFVVSAHREENVDEPERLSRLMKSLNALASRWSYPILFSTHPRTRARLDKLPRLELSPLISFAKPFGFFDYINLQVNAFCVISDSGTLTEEASILGFASVMVRETHERPEGMDEGSVLRSSPEPSRLIASVEMAIAHAATGFRQPPDYVSGDVSRKIVRLILSYTDFVNNKVWSRPLI